MFKRKKKVFFRKRKKSLSFERNRQILWQPFVLWDPNPTKKKTFKEFIFKLTLPRLIFTFSLLTISSLYVTKFALISIIMCSSIFATVFGICSSMYIYESKKEVVTKIFEWCDSIYDVEKKYHKSIHGLAKNKLIDMENLSYKCLKWLRIIMYGNSVFATLGFGTICQFLPENIYPRLTPSLPLYLPFKNQKTWLSFISTTLVQTVFAIDMVTISILLFGTGITVFIHILGFMDIIQLAAENWKEELLNSIKDNEFEPSTSEEPTTSQQPTTSNLEIINVLEAHTKQSFDEWIQTLNEMICEASSVIESLGELFTFAFLFEELSALGSLFICGLIFTVVHEQYSFAIGILIVDVLFFVVCYFNEQVLKKFENINQTLYDIPWYTLTTRQIKSLMILLHCDKINEGIMVGNIHGLTFERFGIIVKAGYTNMLVLKDLIQK